MRFRLLFISLASVFFILLAVNGLLRYQEENRTSVILLTVESLRYDLVNQETTPNLLQAAEYGYRSHQHRAVSGWTGTNMITLLSGLSPFQSGVHTRGQSVDHNLQLPLELLVQKGYRVAGLQGFMTMDMYRNLGLGIKDVGSDSIFWLTQQAEKKQPFFLWEHYLNTHLPYRPGRDHEVTTESLTSDEVAMERIDTVRTTTHIKSGSIDFQPEDVPAIHALQAVSVREFDVWFGKFWRFFIQSGLRRRCLLIVTADHGDEHGERGNVGHASTNLGGHLHEEIVRVPFFIWVPENLVKRGWPRVIKQSEHTDIMVTLLELLGISVPGYLEGRNLFGPSPPGQWFGMTSGGGFSEKDPENISYFEYGTIEDRWKILWREHRDGRTALRLYDLDDDPLERIDLYPKYGHQITGIVDTLASKIQTAKIQPVRPDLKQNHGDQGPAWVFPSQSGTYSYKRVAGRFYFEWQGGKEDSYILQYQAGIGDDMIDGELEIRGVKKDFGNLSKRFWETWVVPASPMRVRVRRVNQGGWSSWLELEAVP